MSDPVTVMDALGEGAGELDRLSKDMDSAVDKLNQAEMVWDNAYDEFIEELVEDTAKKRLPGEDVRVSLCRRARPENRLAWKSLREARRNVEKLEKQITAKRAVLSARQSELGALRDEARGSGFTPSGPVIGGRRAA